MDNKFLQYIIKDGIKVIVVIAIGRFEKGPGSAVPSQVVKEMSKVFRMPKDMPGKG
jgi:hypothetical protein